MITSSHLLGGDTQSRRGRLEQLRAALLNERQSFDAHWAELGAFLKPRRTRFQTTDRNRGDRRNSSIIDSTPLFALRTLQSGLHAGLTSPARPWLRLTMADTDLAENPRVKRWLHTVTQRMLTVFQRSNLYNTLPTLYGDMGGFGTGAMGVVEDEKDLLRTYSYPLGSYVVGLDERGVANTFIRDYVMTVRQLVVKFGKPEDDYTVGRGTQVDWSKFSRAVRNAWDRGNYETAVDVSWAVVPNDEQDESRLEARYAMPWRSCYFEHGAEADTFLRESGFRTFPIMVPRWDVTGEDSYGTDCPGMTALGDTKALQIMHKRKAKAIDKGLDPPLVGPAHLRGEKTSLLPGDITYSDMREGQQGLRPIHEVRLEGIEWLTTDINEYQARVNRAFYADLFLMLAMGPRPGQPPTAREIEERHEEKMLMLGPVLERTNDELLDPLIDRTFAIMEAAGAIPEPPEEIEGQDLKVEYVSILAQAQKLVGIVGQDRFIATALTVTQAAPEARHKINWNQILDDAGQMLGVNPHIIRTDEEAEARAQAEADAIAQAQQAQNLKTVAQAGQALGNTPLGDGTALDEVIGR